MLVAVLIPAFAAGALDGQAPASASPASPTLPAPAATPAQDGGAGAATPTPSTSTISVKARLVNIPVVVRDKKGALVQNLTKESFVLQVDGHPQTIRYFNVDTDLPLTLGLLVDTSMSQRDVIDDERAASIAFLDKMLIGPPDRDKAFVVQFAGQTDLLQDVTSSKPKLQAALKQLDSPSFSGGNSGGSKKDTDPDNSVGSSSRSRHGGGTTLYDALFLSSDEIMAKQKGRKALIILSDGDDTGSKESLNSSIEAAQRADTIVYAIYFKGRDMGGQNNQSQRQGGGPGGGGGRGGMGGGFPGGGGGGGRGGMGGGGGQQRPQSSQASRADGKKILERMAGETGGRLFEVTKKQTVADIYSQIGEELRAQYRLGYSPDAATAAEGYHQIDLSLIKGSPKDLTIQTRDGYYTGN
jgi:VWFA-related protein